MTGDEVLDTARRRAELLNGWAHPERHAPLVLPDSLPGGVPPGPDIYAEVLDLVSGQAGAWTATEVSDRVEWTADGHMAINGVDQGIHDVP